MATFSNDQRLGPQFSVSLPPAMCIPCFTDSIYVHTLSLSECGADLAAPGLITFTSIRHQSQVSRSPHLQPPPTGLRRRPDHAPTTFRQLTFVHTPLGPAC